MRRHTDVAHDIALIPFHSHFTAVAVTVPVYSNWLPRYDTADTKHRTANAHITTTHRPMR